MQIELSHHLSESPMLISIMLDIALIWPRRENAALLVTQSHTTRLDTTSATKATSYARPASEDGACKTPSELYVHGPLARGYRETRHTNPALQQATPQSPPPCKPQILMTRSMLETRLGATSGWPVWVPCFSATSTIALFLTLSPTQVMGDRTRDEAGARLVASLEGDKTGGDCGNYGLAADFV